MTTIIDAVSFGEDTLSIRNNNFTFSGTTLHSKVTDTINSARNGSPPPVIWGNPTVVCENHVTKPTVNRLTFSLLMNSLNLVKTKPLWALNKPLHHTAVSRCRDGLRFSELSYKYAYAYYRIASNNRITHSLVDEVAEQCGIEDNPHELIEILKRLGGIQQLKLKVTPDLPTTYRNLRHELDVFMEDTKRQIAGRTYQKLRFITWSTHYDIDDLLSEITAGVVSTYMHSRCYKSKAHSENYSRAFIQTCALRIISAFTKYDENVAVWADPTNSPNSNSPFDSNQTFSYRNTSLSNPAMSHWCSSSGHIQEGRAADAEVSLHTSIDRKRTNDVIQLIMDMRKSRREDLIDD